MTVSPTRTRQTNSPGTDDRRSREHSVAKPPASAATTGGHGSVSAGRGSYHPGVELFAQAVAASKRAARARAAATSGDHRWEPSPRDREIDACVLTIVLADAALECMWHWAGLPPRKWPRHVVEGLVDAASAVGREAPPVTAETLRDLAGLRAWRNFLHHGSATARRRLAAHLGRTDWDDLEDLTADYAAHVVALTEQIATAIAQATGAAPIKPAETVWTGWPSAERAREPEAKAKASI